MCTNLLLDLARHFLRYNNSTAILQDFTLGCLEVLRVRHLRVSHTGVCDLEEKAEKLVIRRMVLELGELCRVL